ncbi:MAG: hypothetical protein L6455_15415 [Kiritimatiellae bacterium]|nr:hypothetical protein [Kiritimatiellia bacterium]
MVTACSILTACVGSSLADTHTWKNNTRGDWAVAVKWNEVAVPVAGDDVVITNANGGTGAKGNGTNGTVVWRWLPPPGTMFSFR